MTPSVRQTCPQAPKASNVLIPPGAPRMAPVDSFFPTCDSVQPLRFEGQLFFDPILFPKNGDSYNKKNPFSMFD